MIDGATLPAQAVCDCCGKTGQTVVAETRGGGASWAFLPEGWKLQGRRGSLIHVCETCPEELVMRVVADRAARQGTADEPTLFRAGKKASGRLLDGVQHDGLPA